jgi:predicted amidophosphoribosyltransferase
VPVRAPLCARCGTPTAWPVERCRVCSGRRVPYVSARSAVAYAGPARPLVAAWKEGALRPLDRVAAELVLEHVACPAAADVITYIPPDRDRSVRRGHHPPQGLARQLGRAWGLEVRPLLRRRRTIARQTGLRLDERRRNVRGAFAAAGDVRGTVVVVDDVYTTGSTVAAAATALRSGSVRAVHVVTLARALR